MAKVADKEELLKVLDENGYETGRLEKRSIVHNEKLFHNEIALWIIDRENKRILVQRRSKLKKLHPNKIALCAGHVVENETFKEALFKEAKEEIGVNLKKFNVYKLVTLKMQEEGNYCFSHHYYIFANIPIKKFKIQKEELSEVFYVDYEEFRDAIKNNDEDIAIKWRNDYMPLFDALDDIILEKFEENNSNADEIDDLELDEMNDVWDEMDEEDMI